MEVLIDPNEFQIAQDIGFASFNRINTQILWVALAILVATIVFSLKYWHCFDVLALGRENAINLGIDYQKTLKVLLILVAILTSVSTALVGPLTFLGLLVMNVAFEFVRDYRHKVLIPAAMLISIITLVLGQLLVTHIFTFRTTLSIIVNFCRRRVLYLFVIKSKQKMAIEIRNITKSYGSKKVVDNVSVTIPTGENYVFYRAEWCGEEYGAVYYEPFVECG